MRTVSKSVQAPEIASSADSMENFQAVAPARAASNRPARAAALTIAMVLAAVALVVVSNSGNASEPVRASWTCLGGGRDKRRSIKIANLPVLIHHVFLRCRLQGPYPVSSKSLRSPSASSKSWPRPGHYRTEQQ